MKLIDLSPSRLIALSFAGNPIAVSGFALMSSRTFAHLAHRVGFLAYFLPCLSLILLGVMISYKAATTLADGVRLERWTTDELGSLRRTFDHPLWLSINLCMIAFAVGVLAIEIRSHHQGLVFFYLPILYFSYWISGIKRSLKEPRALKLPPPRIAAARLQSQHWGH